MHAAICAKHQIPSQVPHVHQHTAKEQRCIRPSRTLTENVDKKQTVWLGVESSHVTFPNMGKWANLKLAQFPQVSSEQQMWNYPTPFMIMAHSPETCEKRSKPSLNSFHSVSTGLITYFPSCPICSNHHLLLRSRQQRQRLNAIIAKFTWLGFLEKQPESWSTDPPRVILLLPPKRVCVCCSRPREDTW